MSEAHNKFALEHAPRTPKVVEKTWGKEVWYSNNEEQNYCGKILHINKGQSFSMHAHLKKRETFLNFGPGLIKVELIDCHSHNADIHTFELKPGQSLEIPQMLPHRLTALEDSTVLEASTFHRDEDSYRYWR